MIEAIAKGLAAGEAARTKKAVEEVASRNPGYTRPSQAEIDEMVEVMDLRPGGPVPGVYCVAITEQRIEDAVRYAVEGSGGFETAEERVVAELAARKAISLLTGEMGMYAAAFVTNPDSRDAWAAA